MDQASRYPTEDLPLEDLHLDPLNPRIPAEAQTTDEQAMLRYIADYYNAIEVAGSIARFGYFPSEPVIAVERKNDDAYAEDDGYVVVEGNRRVTALRLLRNPTLAQGLDDEEEWEELAEDVDVPKRIPVVIAPTRREVAPIIGYRHISGIAPWEPYAKARFIADLVERDGRTLDEVADVVGERYTNTASLYRNYEIVRQAEEEFEVDASNAKQRFGVFSRALTSAPLRDYIGAPAPSDVEPQELPLPQDKAGNVQDLLSWLFGDDDDPPVISESREITALGRAVESDEGIDILKSSRDLEAAYEAAGGVLERLVRRLSRARSNLQAASKDMPGHEDDEAVVTLLVECEEALQRLKEHDAQD